MDKFKALDIEKELIKRPFLGYKVLKYINHGKSAAVFKVEKDQQFYALKIFDNELIERFGHEIQLNRIQKEIELKDHNYENLIKIVEGGTTAIESNDFYYIIMEFIDGKNLFQFINENEYDQSFILGVLDKLYTLTELLLNDNIVHRDIKPENIMVDSNNNIVLMDLGVLKLVGSDSLTDVEEKQFIGTLRYSSPEYLRREENDDAKDWRAINLYQIGCVLHDLITKEEIFNNESPYTNLVYAIKEKKPIINSDIYNSNIIQLAYDLLTKDPLKRNELIDDSRIKSIVQIDDSLNSKASKFDRIKRMTQKNRITLEEIESITRSNKEKELAKTELANNIENQLIESLNEIMNEGVISGFNKMGTLTFNSDRKDRDLVAIRNTVFRLKGDLTQGILRDFFIVSRFINNENNEITLFLVGIIPSVFFKIKDQEARSIFELIEKEKNNVIQNRTMIKRSSQLNRQISVEFNNFFNGVYSNDDIIRNCILDNCLGLISEIIKTWEPEVTSELDRTKNIIEKNNVNSVSVSSPIKTRIISKWENL